jgi:hypothetical protein
MFVATRRLKISGVLMQTAIRLSSSNRSPRKSVRHARKHFSAARLKQLETMASRQAFLPGLIGYGWFTCQEKEIFHFSFVIFHFSLVGSD